MRLSPKTTNHTTHYIQVKYIDQITRETIHQILSFYGIPQIENAEIIFILKSYRTRRQREFSIICNDFLTFMQDLRHHLSYTYSQKNICAKHILMR